MTVLAILGSLIALFLIYGLVEFINKLSEENYGYTFFNVATLGVVSVSYYFIYFGYQMWQDVLKYESGDPLNGIVLMAIGGIILLFFIVHQISETSILVGVPVTIFQLLIYAPLAYLIVLGFLLAMAMMFQSRPVWVINDKD